MAGPPNIETPQELPDKILHKFNIQTKKSGNSRLTVLHQNAQEMSNKINRIIHLIQNISPHIFIISEHGLNTEEIEKTNHLPGYCLKAHHSRKNHRKGGVAIYVAESLDMKTEEICVSQHSIDFIFEVAVIKIKLTNITLHVMGTYRSPNYSLDEACEIITKMIEETKIENSPLIIMGDIHVDILKPDRKTVKVNETLAYHNIERITLPPTRITHSSKTSIDWICTNIDLRYINTKVHQAGISDHTAQTCTLYTTMATQREPVISRRNLKNSNLNALKLLLQDESWEDVNNEPCAEKAYDSFNRTLTFALNSACPKVPARPRRRSKPKHFADKEAGKLKEQYLLALNRFEMTGSEAKKVETAQRKKAYDLKLKTLRKKATTDYVNKADNKSKAVWEVIGTIRGKKKGVGNDIKLQVDGQTITNPEDVTNHFNTFFVNAADSTLSTANGFQQNTQNHLGTSTPYEFPAIHHTNEEEVKHQINNLKAKNSAGIDDISSKILKHCRDQLTYPLVDIFNKSFNQGNFPSAMKATNVYLKFKNGNTTEVSSYRPISLISIFSKLCEKIVLERLLRYLAQNNLLTDSQHGFTRGKSTTSAAIKLIETVIDSIETGQLTAGVFLDLSKAFDCLGHDRIIKKLQLLGITGTALNWFRSYLEGRTQLVELQHTEGGITNSIRSQPLPITRGVPQGSVLGPVLFIIFINDMPQYLKDHCETLMYADDTTLLLSESTPDNLAVKTHTAINMAYQYCHMNDLVPNPSKTSLVGFGRRADLIQQIPDVEMVDTTKFLGITLDNNLSWTPHLDSLSKKLNTSLYVIRHIKLISNPEVARTAYFALFESHFRYGLVVWGGTSLANLGKIMTLQKKAIRILANLQQQESCRNAFKTLRILTVVAAYIREVILHVDGQNLQRSCDIHNYNTRHAALYALPTHHLTLYERKPSYMGRKLHNHLPQDVKTKTGKALKTALNNWLIDRPYYTVEEFVQHTLF